MGDNLFNPDPYYQQGGDMVRVGGLRYTCDPTEIGAHQRHVDQGQAAEEPKIYKVAGWKPGIGRSEKRGGGEPIWDLDGALAAAAS